MHILYYIGGIIFIVLFLNALEDAQVNWTDIPGYKPTEDKSVTFEFGGRIYTVSYEEKYLYHNLYCMVKHKLKNII